MKTFPMLEFECAVTPDPRFRQLADALTVAIAILPANQDLAFLEDCMALETKLAKRGRYLASLN